MADLDTMADVQTVRRAAAVMVAEPSPMLRLLGQWLADAAQDESDYIALTTPEDRADPMPGDEFTHAVGIASAYLAERRQQ